MNSLFLTDLYKDRKLLNAEGELGAEQCERFLCPRISTDLRASALVPCFSSSRRLGWSVALSFVALLSPAACRGTSIRAKSVCLYGPSVLRKTDKAAKQH